MDIPATLNHVMNFYGLLLTGGRLVHIGWLVILACGRPKNARMLRLSTPNFVKEPFEIAKFGLKMTKFRKVALCCRENIVTRF